MKQYIGRSAFTLLELIFVIVILGIVASIGSEMIAKVYGQYIVQRAQHRASIKTELAALQIANRLAYAVPGTVIRRLTKASAGWEYITEALPPGSSGDYDVLQWVGGDMDSFNATNKPGWSGFCDTDPSTATVIKTPGSALGTTTQIITNLSGSTPASNSLSLYFQYDLTHYPATITDADTITLGGTGAKFIYERYKLAWSSYALVIENKRGNIGDLYLYYNFAPIPKVAISGSRSLLIKNISNFKFIGAGRTIRFKICKQEQISENMDDNITACKEKAVF